jgi:hypothetical protein
MREQLLGFELNSTVKAAQSVLTALVKAVHKDPTSREQ